MGELLDKAWEAFDKAASFEAKSKDKAKTEGVRNISAKAADRKLDEACVLEEQALTAGEAHA